MKRTPTIIRKDNDVTHTSILDISINEDGEKEIN